MKQIIIGEIFRQDYRITCNDMDSEYRLNSQAILNLSQDTIAAFLTTRHLAAFDLQKEGFTWVLSEYTIDVAGPLPLWREKVEVQVIPSEISSVKSHFDYRILNKDGETVVSGTSIWSIINVETGRPELISDHCEIVGESGQRHPRNMIEAVTHSDLDFKYITNISDIDFNGHVHNVSYLKIALSAIPYELSKTNVLKKMVIKFLRQSFINETLTCSIERMRKICPRIHPYAMKQARKYAASASVCRVSRASTSRFWLIATESDFLDCFADVILGCRSLHRRFPVFKRYACGSDARDTQNCLFG